MKNLKAIILTTSLIIIILFVSCGENNENQISSDYKEVEVKFETRYGNDNIPEYELLFIGDGKVIAKRLYKEGKAIISKGKIPDGRIVEKYENGSIKNEFFYKNGKREGKAKAFYQSGNLKIESSYKEDNPDGITKIFYENGDLKAESKIKNNELIYYKEYYKNGQLKKDVKYKNGEGFSETYDKDGNSIKSKP